MPELNQLFRKRIGMADSQKITFTNLDLVLEKTAFSIPFENTNIILKNTYKISKESLIKKILIKNQGGLCYDINSIFYFFLLENGFNVRLVRGVVYNELAQKWSPTGKTHVAILIDHDGQTFLIDTGFGTNLPLKPVPLNGEIAVSANGEFRIVPAVNEYGDYILEIKLHSKEKDWRIGYTFDTNDSVLDISELDKIQQIISVHPDSSFNKHYLITMLTNKGNMILTDTSFTQYMNGNIQKEPVDHQTFKQLAKKHFLISL